MGENTLFQIEGEEFQIGPDMNAISFTQTRSPAELLKLSESLVKPSHVMNVEASQHSQSVTVSIFDALAEILTSTPRNRLSSTTEVNKKQNINTDLIQALNGVSNNINVNSRVLPSQDTLSLNVNVNTNTNVQNTDLTPNVNNLLAAAGAPPTLTTPQASSTPLLLLPSLQGDLLLSKSYIQNQQTNLRLHPNLHQTSQRLTTQQWYITLFLIFCCPITM